MKPWHAEHVRGDRVVTPGGGRGRFVGVSRTGLVWVDYEDEGDSFARMCVTFDDAERRAEQRDART